MAHRPLSVIISLLTLVLALTLFQKGLHSSLLTNRAAIEYLSMTSLHDQLVTDVARKLSTTLSYFSALPIVGKEDRWNTIVASLKLVQNQVSTSSLTTQRVYHEGLFLQRTGQWESAIHSFEIALQQDDAFVPAILSLAEISEKLDKHTNAMHLIERVENTEPNYAFTVSVQPGLELLGFDVDENAFALASRIPLVIYWHVLNDEVKTSLQITDDGQFRTYAWGDRAIQVGDATNLVSNAGFERFPFIAADFPTSFSRAYTPESIWAPYHLKAQTRQDVQSTTLCLNNSTEYYRSGVTTLPLLVEPGTQYLAAVWVKDDSTSRGSPMIYETRTSGHEDVVLHHLPDRLNDDGWHLHADVISVTQPFVRFWLANFDAVGEACFDNLLLIPLSYSQLSPHMSGKP